ncbi:MAG: homogentisate 1,2-dioxygenase [Haliea sp.]
MAPTDLRYLTGFGNEHETEAVSNALPIGRFSPQRVNHGLYAEQFSTTAFTAPRAANRRSWLYRIRPSVMQGDYEPFAGGGQRILTGPLAGPTPPNLLRWDPLPLPGAGTDIIDGLTTVATCGDARAQTGMAIHLYAASASMSGRYFYCADGEWLLIPQQGELLLRTECGRLHLQPGEIAVVPRGMKFAVDLPAGPARGYLCENYGAPLTLPERGPVGANGFANDRDFQYPVAAFEEFEGNFELLCKFGGHLYRCDIGHSPLDVVAWTGNSAPYKYALSRFNVMGSVSYDHPDPSIYTVLTSPSDTAGVANADFVIFPPRWTVTEDTFRPPWYHRNIMSEYMGLIEGVYEAREAGFLPGGGSLHNCMSPHGPEAAVFTRASEETLAPERYQNTLAFMLESRYLFQPTPWSLATELRQRDYIRCWDGLRKQFRT